MEASEKASVFSQEISYIKNPKIREFTIKAVESLPDYFFEVASSSTGRYHPQYALGKGGLVKHVRAATRIAVELFRIFKFTEDEKDIVLASLILHDGWKHGKVMSQYTVTEHPLVAKEELENNENLRGIISDEYLSLIVQNIARHMGIFNKDYKTNEEVLPKPETKMQNTVFLCDYIASRKCLEFNFDIEVLRE